MQLHPSVVPLVAAAALPTGIGAALIARKLAAGAQPSAVIMIAANSLLGAWAALVMPAGLLLAVTCGLAWALLVLACVDALVFRLPDVLTLPLIVAGLALSAWLPEHDFVGHIVATLLGMGSFYAISLVYRWRRGHEGLGLGDAKLAGVAGAWLGWEALPSVILLGSCGGLIWVGLATMRRGKAALAERIPFGVALCFAIWMVWLYGPLEIFGAG